MSRLIFLSLALLPIVCGQRLHERMSAVESKLDDVISRLSQLEKGHQNKNYENPAKSPVKHIINYETQNYHELQPFEFPNEVPTEGIESGKPTIAPFRPKDCAEIFKRFQKTQRLSTFYTIYPISGNRPLEVYCDMDTLGGGWTIVQQRGFQGPIRLDFNKTWLEYVKGFGELDSDYWLGLDTVSSLTKDGDQEVLFEFLLRLSDGRNYITYLNYKEFKVENADQFYKLNLHGLIERHSTSPLYYLEKQSGMPFSTKDHDNTGTNNRNCKHNSGWWLQPAICHRQPDLNMPFAGGVLHLHKYTGIVDRNGVAIKIRTRKHPSDI